mmetsp:Transcript_51035/g.114769  ORF Transcript_51035/g.114769 Transcript_51035/m.114769 type:complete len:125 (-) Transcript_51035:315-689(-)
MAKKVDCSFMKHIYTDDEWEREVQQSAGVLLIIDLHAKAWGPCEMLAGHFQNIFFDYGEKYSMRFVRAERDKLTASIWNDFKFGSSQPTFVMCLNGEKVGVVEGPIIPQIRELIFANAAPIEKE